MSKEEYGQPGPMGQPSMQQGPAPLITSFPQLTIPPGTVLPMSDKEIRGPVVTNCPVCRNNVVTTTENTKGIYFWLCCLCFTGIASFCMECEMDVETKCPSCNNLLNVATPKPCNC